MAETAIDAMLDAIEWTPIAYRDTPRPGSLHATHEGTLDLMGHGFRCYRLSDGNRVIDADDVAAFFGGTIVEKLDIADA